MKEYEARKLSSSHTEQTVEIHEGVRGSNSESVVMGDSQILDTIMQDFGNTFRTPQPLTPTVGRIGSQQIDSQYSNYKMMEIQYKNHEE